MSSAAPAKDPKPMAKASWNVSGCVLLAAQSDPPDWYSGAPGSAERGSEGRRRAGGYR